MALDIVCVYIFIGSVKNLFPGGPYVGGVTTRIPLFADREIRVSGHNVGYLY